MALRAPLVVVDGRVQQLQAGDTLSGVQPLDADLTAIAALSDTGGWAKRTGADTWAISTPTAADVGADPAGTAASAVGTHEGTYSHANYNIAYGWGNHASGGYLKADGTVPLTADWTTGIFSIVGSDHWYMRADSMKMYFGAGDDCSVTYNGTNMVFNSQEAGTGGFHFVGGTVGIGVAPSTANGIGLLFSSGLTSAGVTGFNAVISYGSPGSGDMGSSVYGFRGDMQTSATWDGAFTGAATAIGMETIVNHYAAGLMKSAYGNRCRIVLRPNGGSITTAVGVYCHILNSGAPSTITNAYGLYIEPVNAATTKNYAIYCSAGTTYLGGDVGIGRAVPTEKLQVSGNVHLYNDNNKLMLGAGKDATIYYNATDMVFDSQEDGTGGFYFANGTMGIGTPPLARVGLNCILTSVETASPVFGISSSVSYGAAASGNTTESIYGAQGFAQTAAAYDGDVTGALYGAEFVVSHYGTGTLSLVYGGQFRIVLRADAGDIVDAIGGHFGITDLASVGAITNAYGLYIDDINVGTTLNYAIYTNAGDVRFGGDTVIVGTLQAGGYKSSDGTAGGTTDVAVAKVGGGTRTLTFKDGLYTSYADS